MGRIPAILRSGLGVGLAAVAAAAPSRAGEADVVAVSVECEEAPAAASAAAKPGDRICLFRVSVLHADQGWDHYADGWEVMPLSGDEVLATRVLQHPHVNEQPFERSLGGVRIPADLGRVRVRAHDKVHGHGGIEKTVELPD